MRSMAIYELNADYVLYAKLMGLPDKKITGYVFRNAMLPQISGLALSLGTMVSGSLITEIVFNYPGHRLLALHSHPPAGLSADFRLHAGDLHYRTGGELPFRRSVRFDRSAHQGGTGGGGVI